MHGPAQPREQAANRRHVCTPNISTLPHPRKNRALAPPGTCYDAIQPRSSGAGSGERDGKGRTRIPFRHAPVPGRACYGPVGACCRSRSAFEARQPFHAELRGINLRAERHARHGMPTQLHPVTKKMHASSAAQNPLHSGWLASPHAVVRHSHAPPDATAEQWPPSAHVPSQRRVLELKSQGPLASVVVVVPPMPPGQAVSPSCRQSRRTLRRH